MLIHPTVDRLRVLGLTAMADTLVELQNNPEATGMPHADWLGLLVDREVTARDNRRLTAPPVASIVRSARTSLPVNGSAIPTTWSLSAQPAPASPGLPARSRNKACRDGFSVLYKRASRLFADLAQARGEGRLARLIAALESVDLLILDEWGPEPLTADQRRDLLEIVDDC